MRTVSTIKAFASQVPRSRCEGREEREAVAPDATHEILRVVRATIVMSVKLACCDDMCCDARGVMHEYIMAIFLGKSENQEGGGMLIVKVGGN